MLRNYDSRALLSTVNLVFNDSIKTDIDTYFEHIFSFLNFKLKISFSLLFFLIFLQPILNVLIIAENISFFDVETSAKIVI